MPVSSPASDTQIARKYSVKTLEHKLENKRALQEELGWVAEPKRPILCLPCGMTDSLGGHLFEEVLPGLLELPVNLLIRGRGSKHYGELFTRLTKGQAYRLRILADDDVSYLKMLAGSDVAVFFSDPATLPELEEALLYGVIPVSPDAPILDNYNPVQETGNAFIFDDQTKWQCFASLVRALETYKFPFDWRTIQRHAMESVERK